MKELLEKTFLNHPEYREKFPTLVLYLNANNLSSPSLVSLYLARYADPTKPSGYHMSEYINTFFEYIDTKYDCVIIIIDEVDKLMAKRREQTDTLLYSLLRAREMRQLKKTYICLVCIANDTRVREKLSPGTQSSFGMVWQHFPRYTRQQLFDILKRRAEKAIFPDKIDDTVLDAIAFFCNERGGDCRQAITLLKLTAEVSERKKEKINLIAFNVAKELYEKEMIKNEISDMSFHEILVFYVLCSYKFRYNKNPSVDLIYTIYVNLSKRLKRETVKERMVRHYLKDMVKKDLVEEFMEVGKLYYRPIIDSKTVSLLLEDFYHQHQVRAEEFLKEQR